MTKTEKYTKWVALSMVMANMIGTGVFTSLGYQLYGLPDGFTIFSIWLLGGIIALCGAFCYAEISTRLKESGGEYLFLSRIFHPVLGFMSGWISLVFGFAGAIAAAALAIGKYSAPVFNLPGDQGITVLGNFIPSYEIVSVLIIVALTGVHCIGVKTGGAAQNILTSIKLVLIVVFVAAPFFVGDFEPTSTALMPTEQSGSLIFSLAFASSLAWVLYAYSGWNASAYIAGNIENPRKSLPFSLIVGTLSVTVIYIVLNMIFLYVSPMENLVGKEEIGYVVAVDLFGKQIGTIFSGIFSLALISTLSAMIMAGPRVSEKIGEDYALFRKLTIKSKGGTPLIALFVQATLAILMMMFLSFAQLIQTIAICLSFFSILTVAGLFVLRSKEKSEGKKQEDVYRIPLYPILPIIFILANLWMIVSFGYESPWQVLYAFGFIAIGAFLYLGVKLTNPKNK